MSRRNWSRSDELASPMRRRCSRTSTAPQRSPSTSTVPVVGKRYSDRTLTRLVLPDPFGPSTIHRSCGAMSQSSGPSTVAPS